MGGLTVRILVGAAQRFGLFFAFQCLWGCPAARIPAVGMGCRRDHVWRFEVSGALGAPGRSGCLGECAKSGTQLGIGDGDLENCLTRRSSPTPPSERKPPCTKVWCSGTLPTSPIHHQRARERVERLEASAAWSHAAFVRLNTRCLR